MPSMAAADILDEAPRRERGTLKDTLPRKPLALIALVCAASACLATALFANSFTNPATTNDLASLGVVALLGATSTAVGIVFGDSLSHAFAFGVAHLLVGYGDMQTSVAAALPPLALAALASFKEPKAVLSSLDATFLLKPLYLQACCAVPFLSLVHQSTMTPVYRNFSFVPLGTVAFMILLLMRIYHKHRSHKHGGLLTTEMQSQAVFAGISILLSCSIALESNPDATTIKLVVFLLGSLYMIFMSYAFASVADVWYTVGSGQFQMVSLDTAGLMLFFIAPAVVLYLRFVDKYGSYIASKASMVQLYLWSGKVYNEDVISFSLVMTLAMISAVGVPLLNSLCPLGGYLFSRAYTHGQPNTKKVALCINFSDLPKEVRKRMEILNALKMRKEGVLNIFVTLEDIAMFPDGLKMLGKGHTIALAPSVVPSELQDSFCGLTLFQGNQPNIEFAHHEYCELFGEEPSWMLARGATGRHPSLLSVAKDLGMKVAYWSTSIELSGNALTSEQTRVINGECLDHNGGSILYVSVKNGASSTLLCELIKALDDGFSLESLNDVAKDQQEMVL
ncbi:hypothetical protein ACHAXT_009349 [Thalassiosira profunda]